MSLSKYAPQDAAKIVRKLIEAGLKMGFSVSVYDGEEWTLKQSTMKAEIFDALATTEDGDTIRFRDSKNQSVGTFSLIYENGEDVICDHSDNDVCDNLFKVATA